MVRGQGRAAVSSISSRILLIVDDDPEVLSALGFLGAARDYEVRACADAARALEAVTADVACLVIDQGLPDMSGLDLLARLRGFGVRAPAVLVTTAPSQALRRQASAAEVMIVEKPLLDDALFDQVERLCRAA